MSAVSAHPRSRRWMAFFLILGVLAGLGIVIPLVYNLRIQLRPEQLADARRRWQEHGPADYDLQCLVKREEGGVARMEREYAVQVRGGRVVLVVDQGEVVYVDPSLAAVAGPGVRALSWEDPRAYGVPVMLEEIAAALRQRETGQQRNYVKADFDPHDGHPYHYIHRMPRTKDRVEWFVKLKRVSIELPR